MLARGAVGSCGVLAWGAAPSPSIFVFFVNGYLYQIAFSRGSESHSESGVGMVGGMRVSGRNGGISGEAGAGSLWGILGGLGQL